MATEIQLLENKYLENRQELLSDDGTVRTPFVVLREVAKDFGAPIHLEIHEVHISPLIMVYQAEMFTGRLRGRGEAPRRNLALELAAYDLIVKMETKVGFEVPPYGLLPGSRINPNVFVQLIEICIVLELTPPRYVPLPNDPEEEVKELYMYKCQVGQLICIGKSDSQFVAQRIAAKKLLEQLTETEIPLDEVKIGEDCHILEEHNIQPGTSKKKMEILKYRADSRESEEVAAAAQIDFVEDVFGNNTETIPRVGRGTSPDVSERLGLLNLHGVRARVMGMRQAEDEVQETQEEADLPF